MLLWLYEYAIIPMILFGGESASVGGKREEMRQDTHSAEVRKRGVSLVGMAKLLTLQWTILLVWILAPLAIVRSISVWNGRRR